MALITTVLLPPGLLAARPAFGQAGRVYYATDVPSLTYDTGVAWVSYAPGGGAGSSIVLELTNNSGGAVAADDVVIIDPTQANSFTTTTVEGQFAERVGIAQEAINDGVAGSILFFGLSDVSLDGAAALGDYLRTDGVATQGTPVDDFYAGIFGQVLEVGAAPAAILFGRPQIGAWNLIAETVLGSPAASVTFASIPQTYRSLVIQAQVRSDRVAQNDTVDIIINADAGANYDYARNTIFNSSVSTADGRAANVAVNANCEGGNARASCFSMAQITFFGYALNDREKYLLSWGGVIYDLSTDVDLQMTFNLGHWRSTAPITSVLLEPDTGPNWDTGCRFQLYGII